jgi:hypothetical protein
MLGVTDFALKNRWRMLGLGSIGWQNQRPK